MMMITDIDVVTGAMEDLTVAMEDPTGGAMDLMGAEDPTVGAADILVMVSSRELSL